MYIFAEHTSAKYDMENIYEYIYICGKYMYIYANLLSALWYIHTVRRAYVP